MTFYEKYLSTPEKAAKYMSNLIQSEINSYEDAFSFEAEIIVPIGYDKRTDNTEEDILRWLRERTCERDKSAK